MLLNSLTTSQKKMVIILILTVITLAVYWQVQKFEFVNYDDQVYVTQNFEIQSGMTWRSVKYAFTDLRTSNWHPLTMLSHALDWELFGNKAGGHHWTNIIIHLFNVVLLFLLLNSMTGAIWRSALVAALFAVHPINVESVAWVAERKNVLSTFFWILTMLAYVWYVKRPNWKRYVPVFITFAFGLMSKPMLVTLPFVLLLIDYWPLHRMAIESQDRSGIQSDVKTVKLRLSFLLVEKIPLFILTAFSIFLTVYAARGSSTIADLTFTPMPQRIANAAVSYVLYIKKMFWPADLAVFYPLGNISAIPVVLAAAALIAVTAVCCLYFKKFPYLIVGWLWYLGTLVPVIGIVQVGSQSMADRYAYVPLIGLFIGLAWLITEWIRGRLLQKMTIFVMIMLLAGLFVAARHQTAYWQDSFTLFQHALQVTKGNHLALVGVGNELIKQNKVDEAIAYFHESINLNPKNPVNYMALAGLGYALTQQDKKEEAIAAFKQALELNPTFDEAHYRMGFVLFKAGRTDEAIAEYRKAIALYPGQPLYHDSLGNAYIVKGDSSGAVREFQEVLRIQPANAAAHNNLGVLYMRQGKTEQAMKHFREALKIQPLFANAHYQLSILLEQKGRKEEALSHYNEAIRINPRFKDMK